jgi:PAS domain S-box-containing protein
VTRRWPPSLRWSLPAILLVLGGAGIAVGYRIDVGHFARMAVEEGREDARLVAYRAVAGIERHLRAGEPADARDVVDAVRVDRSVEFALLVDPAGQVVFATDYAAEGRPLAETAFTAWMPQFERARDRRHETSEVATAERLVLAVPAVLHDRFGAGRRTDRGVLLLGVDLTSRMLWARAAAARRSSVMAAVIAALVASLWILLSRLVTRRAERLVASTHRITQGDFSARGELAGSDELARLSLSIDRMAAALGEKTAALESSERRFRQLIEHGSDVILAVERGGTIRYASPSAERVLGRVPDELVGCRVEDLVDAADAERTAAVVAGAFERPEPDLRREEVRCRAADGTVRILEITGYAPPELRARGEAVLNARDLTSWRELEDQLRQAQKMEAIGRLAGGVAHDFNNYLTAILGYGELLAEHLTAGSAAAGQLDEIRSAARRAASLTGKLLAFGRRQMLQPSDIDLNRVVAGLEELVRRLLGETMLLELDLSPRPVWVHADRMQLEQVILNLATNARDAMSRGGRLTIATERLEPGARPEPNGEAARRPLAILRVRDDGAGMSEEILERIFDPFFTTKEVGRGTGLGLSTVVGIVEQSGGHVKVESSPGAGSVFEVGLPAIEPSGTSEIDRAPSGPLEAGIETVLVVEDEAAIRRMLVATLSAHGYRVLTAETPRRALELLGGSSAELDLLLTDIVMPDLSGPELAAELRILRPELRVLYISGYSEEVVRREGGLEEGARLLAKPFTSRALLAAVRAVLDARPA